MFPLSVHNFGHQVGRLTYLDLERRVMHVKKAPFLKSFRSSSFVVVVVVVQ